MDWTHKSNSHSQGRKNTGGQNPQHQGRNMEGRGGRNLSSLLQGGQNPQHQGRNMEGREGRNLSSLLQGGQNPQHQGRNVEGRGGRNPSSLLQDDPFNLLGATGGHSPITRPTHGPYRPQRGRSHSESRGLTGMRLEVHHTSGAQHSKISSGKQPHYHNQQSNQAGNGIAQGMYREKTKQNDTTSSRKANPPVHPTVHGSKEKRCSTPVRLSNHHKSPLRYGSGHLTASFSTNVKVADTFSTFQTRKSGLGTRARSVLSLSEFLMESKTEDNRRNRHDLSLVQKTGKDKKIDLHTISRLSTLEPSEITMQLAAPGSGLKEFLDTSTIDFQIVEGFMNIINKVITSTTNRQTLMHILSKVHGSVFLKQVLPFHILQTSKTITEQRRKYLFFEHVITLATELSSLLPSSSFTEVTITKTLIQNAFDDMEGKGNIVSAENKKKLMDLEKFLQHLQEKKGEGSLKSDNYIYIIGNRQSTENDFRNLSIYPTYEDICSSQKPSMRPNIIDGSYADARSYLDTHFRLMREDFIRPLRDGISELVKLEEKDLSKANIDDIRIYFETKILSPVCTRTGIVHEVKFSIENLKHVSWDVSRRLLYGSLVCLSKDNFRKMLFATVADRNVDDLKNGVIALIFTEESRQQLAQFKVDDTFLMIEATAYFEAYRHVLEGLKEMVASEIPFQNYIVLCSTAMSPPLYLSQNPAGFTLEKLVQSGKSTLQQDHSIDVLLQSLLCPRKPLKEQFKVLDCSTWPTKEELQLDQSQFRAFQMALTSELAIIQGPPGTGKTYVGLKIMHALLNNSNLWKMGNSPVLVVCYTNHALDQFLEGILKYSKCKIVRVGSRSNSELMKECSLSKIRKLRSRQDLPGYMRAMHAELSEETKSIQDQLIQKATFLQNSTKGVLNENILKKYIQPHHFDSLLFVKENLEHQNTCEISSIILEWLGISAVFKKTEKKGDELTGDSMVMDTAGDRFIKIIDEAEQAEAERMIEEDDDIRHQIRRARQHALAELAKKEYFAFLLNEQENEDHKTNKELDDKDGWQIPPEEKKKLKNQIKHELQKTNDMEEEECELIVDLWQLPLKKRWDVYRFWRSKYLCDIRNEIVTLENQYQIVVNRMTELRNQEDLLILQNADVIGMTTTGAAKFRKLLQNIQPKIVIVEEAAEVLEAHIITTISSSCQHLILIGDHQQLRPTTTVYELAKNFNLEVSMFERLIRMKLPYVRLDYQHRMRPEIAQLLTPHIYDKLENHASVLNYENIKGVCHNLYFVDHNHLEEHIKEGKSRQNAHEAAFVKSLCLYFLQQGYSPSQITILTTYSGQLHCLQKKMPKSQYEGIRVCVVDKYQGEENEIIILSLVRSNLEGNAGFLKIPNRVCVALSRAKKGLFCIGNMELLSKIPLWNAIRDVLQEHGLIGKELKLQCVNHPNTETYVSKSADFDNVPFGGCKIPCQYRLNCGHVCPLFCHPFDPEHKDIICTKPCPNTCENGHKCTKVCSEPCKCEVLVPKEIPLCGHIQDVPCSMPAEKFCCKEPCIKMLDCGHKCVRWCGQDCTKRCPEELTVTLKCGHTVKTLCHIKLDAEFFGQPLQCDVKCEKKLDCGHKCPGSCSSCNSRGFHKPCADPCGIALHCSHNCQEKCGIGCFCIYACEKSCFHVNCSLKCSEPCSPCTEPCGWRCAHKRCTKQCWEPCDRDACDEPCSRILKCGHPCIGLCGEPCPKKCRVCDADEVKELIFGHEENPHAHFVQLMDCSHFFEVTKFSEWMSSKEEDQIIKLKSCPKCSKPIRKNLRFGSLIKQTLSDLEKVKERIAYKWLNDLEMFLSENDTELHNFPNLYQTVQQLQDGNLTLRSLMLVGEKVTFLQKLGAINNKVKNSPGDLFSVLKDIHRLSDVIDKATSKYDILNKYPDLFLLALEAEAAFVKQPNTLSQKMKLLIKELKSKKYTMHLDELLPKLQMLPASMDLINIVKKQTVVCDTELLRQDLWHRCEAGHIYPTKVDENKRCLQCSFSDESED
ncbi:NFX1-type zinc finger-containing protein 1-like [Dendropsophus ebraccatus]|uniref:NFX1-type zinc finger-containing protein 1-like n=1 Tax=Dendropsophus ebraccatus TaxID=150705 RepID=UPI003831FF64